MWKLAVMLSDTETHLCSQSNPPVARLSAMFRLLTSQLS